MGDEQNKTVLQLVVFASLVIAVVLIARPYGRSGSASWPACNGTNVLKPEGYMDFVNDVDAALVCFYSQGCPACDRDAVDLAGKLRLHSGTFPVTFVIVLEGSSEPMGAVANLVSIAQAKVLADEDYVYREQYELPSVPYYFFTKFGVIEWCQDGRLIDGETGENLLWLRLSGEALASSR